MGSLVAVHRLLTVVASSFQVAAVGFSCPAACGVLAPCCCCCRQVASVMSDSVRPHRQQPTRLLCPRDSLGKNTGLGCHFLLLSTLTRDQTLVLCVGRQIFKLLDHQVVPQSYSNPFIFPPRLSALKDRDNYLSLYPKYLTRCMTNSW